MAGAARPGGRRNSRGLRRARGGAERHRRRVPDSRRESPAQADHSRDWSAAGAGVLVSRERMGNTGRE